jgi:predicted Zn finger-like uncharacterized protein
MLIRCPFCRTEAEIPADKEGAKVRCGECDKVYTARPPGARRSSGGTSGLTIGIFVGAGILIAVVFFFINRNKPVGVAPMVVAEEAVEPEAVDLSGWDSEIVRVVRDVYDAAAEGNTERLRGMLHLERLHAAAAAEGEPPAAWSSLSLVEKEEVLSGAAERLTAGEDDVVAQWDPFDGTVLSENDAQATVHVRVKGRDAATSIETRTMEFSLARDPGASNRWKVWKWERWYSPEELAAAKRRRVKQYEKVTLTDGSVVYEAEPRPLGHLDDTPAELRRRIDGAYAQLIDFELRPTENAAALRELEEIGRPAIPILLTGLFEIPLETDEQAMKVNLINQCLEGITGQYTGWKPQVAEGSGTGTTNERRESAIKQWFAWWFRKGHRFEEKDEQPDLLDDLITPTERDLRQLRQDEASAGG